jgi:serine/threonine protein kinase
LTSLYKGTVSLDQVLATGSTGIAEYSDRSDESGLLARSIGNFLALAIRLTAAMHEIHQQRIIHGAINPATILLKAEPSGTANPTLVRILALDLAAKASPQEPGGRLAYISPEQTGRMNWVVDHRTDLYSLGVIFYRLLTGQLPFAANDLLSLVHAHIAAIPHAACSNPPRPAAAALGHRGQAASERPSRSVSVGRWPRGGSGNLPDELAVHWAHRTFSAGPDRRV